MLYNKGMRCILLFLLVSLSYGQSTQVFLEPLEVSAFPNISVQSTLSVSSDLTTERVLRDFELYEDLHKISDYTVELVKSPKKIALIVDTSGSVKDFMTSIKSGVRAFVKQMGEKDEALLVSFSNKVSLKHDLTSDKDSLYLGVDNLEAKGGTRLYDGLYAALGKLPRDNAVSILFTDGKDQYHPDDAKPYSKHSLNSAIGRSRGKQIPVFVIGVGDGTDESVLSNIAQSTGGQYFKATNPEALASIYDKISSLLRARLKITYSSPNENYDGKLRRVTFKETKTKVQHQRVYAVGVAQSKFSKYRADWFNTSESMDISSVDFSHKLESSFSANTTLTVNGGQPTLKPGALNIVGPSSSVDLSNPFNPKIMVDPGKVNFKTPVLNVTPLEVDSSIDIEGSIGGSWMNKSVDTDDSDDEDEDDEMDWSDDD